MGISPAALIGIQARLERNRRAGKLDRPEVDADDGLESALHQKIIDHCNSQWPRWKFIRGRMDKKSTIAKGAHDFTVFLPGGRTLCVECKTKTGKPDTDQRSWSHEMQSIGHSVHVVRSFNAFIELSK